MFKEVKDSLSSGQNIYIRGFGSFIAKKRAAKIGRNIKKNTAVEIPEHFIPAFKPAKEFLVKRQQLLLVSSGFLLLIILFLFGNTIPPKKNMPAPAAQQAQAKPSLQFNDLLLEAKKGLNPEQSERITRLENSVTRGDVKEQQLHMYHQLARFWKDSAHAFAPYAYYTAEAAKLENSEKASPLPPGILPIRKIAEKDPDNLYAQFMLGLGGRKSGQYDKAIERFTIVVNKQPDNMEAALDMAECYELKGDKPNAIKWYSAVRKKIANPNAQKN
ncbi:hypothetical protein F5148DRAFT_1293555 [Russula earlei]|uniref:Uncharacterized protein n=1 Tax=Russula earlei TaxID=71964 RepID=A0ACC0TSZ8_9AGAM|nr:hypothetical protein F5148DRAFT_1293555 [Russula earlei]